MSRHRKAVPTYRQHKQSGQAIVTLTDAAGRRRDVLLGKHNTLASRIEYARVISEWDAACRTLPTAGCGSGSLTINELILAYWSHVDRHYRRADGTPTNEPNEIKYSLKPVKALYGLTRVADFGPMALKACRQRMIENHLARPVINKRVSRIRRMFKWAVENELVPPGVIHGLQAVSGLQRGRSDAREPEPVRAVATERVERTLPFLAPTVAAMVRLQLITGARSGELVTMRTGDFDTSGCVWLYSPRLHKSAHHNRAREIYIGPEGQEILQPWLKTDPNAFIFSPREAEQIRNAKKRDSRKTPLWPSHVRHKLKMKHYTRRRCDPGDHYTTGSFARAVARACDRAFPLPTELEKHIDETEREWLARLTDDQKMEVAAWRRANRWHPHQLRHTTATRLRRQHGIEMARIILGHSTAFTTEIYAEVDRRQALELIARIG